MSFRVIRANRQRKGICPVCGKSVTRSTTFTATVNPFNRNDDGATKTAQEIYEELRLTEWEPDFTHMKCAT